MSFANETLTKRKDDLRRQAYDSRKAQQNKAQIGHRVCTRLIQGLEYRLSHTVMWYLNHRSELPTRQAIAAELDSGKKIVVPYCVSDCLHLWWLHALDELVPGSYGILEPPKARWAEVDRRIDPMELDLIVVPGVGFDRKGNRLGNGQGFYDRFLALLHPRTLRIGVCFESQLFDEIPVGPYDVPMHMIITERRIHRC